MRILRLSIWVAIAALAASLAAAGEPVGPPSPGPKERCPVCGMFVGMDRAWIAAVVFKDGGAVFFDGPKDMFRYLGDPSTYTPGRSASDVKDSYVTEYYSARLTRAQSLYFVVGSDVLGPMGRELVPVEGKENAKTFLADHRGKEILRFRDVTADALKALE